MLHKGHGVVLLQQRLVKFSSDRAARRKQFDLLSIKNILPWQAISAILKLQALGTALAH
jgi:hypothetical protein